MRLGRLGSLDRAGGRIMTASKVGMPKANGLTTSNQAALPTLSKLILPSAIATAQPATMPSPAHGRGSELS